MQKVKDLKIELHLKRSSLNVLQEDTSVQRLKLYVKTPEMC